MSSAELPAELPANPSAAIAELPGSEPSQQKQQRTKEIHELDASSPTSTKTCVKLGKPENTPLQTPGLTPDSAPGPDMDRWGFPLRSSTGGEPKKNGKLLSMMSINELLAIHSELSPQEINDYWRPAITKECNIIQNVLKNLQREAANYPHIDPDIELGNSIEDTRTSEERKIHALKQENQFERNEFEFALTHKDSRKNSMREAYEAELAILSTFIDKFHSVEDNPDCPSAVQTIIEKYALNRHRNSNSSSDDSEFIFVRENDYVERNIQLEILKIHVADLEALTDFYEKKMIEHVRETRSMAKKINGYKKDEIIHNRNIVERDLQIAALNQKIGQVMKMYSPQSQRHGEPSSAPHASKYGKDLPSPSPSEWREQEGIEKKGQEAKYQGYKKEMMGRLPRHVIESDQMADRGRGGLRASDNSGSDVADRFQTLSVDEEDFPFYFAGDSF
ncbi:hypothetical protein FQN54_009434 [Arachnomyces sp. PD_36]|nr:hypothetical protein FQN54_009434 [Arachnomyces sp. PD_36]